MLNNLKLSMYHKTQLNNHIYLALDRVLLIGQIELFDIQTVYIYVYRKDLALNNIQFLMCHKTQPTNNIYVYIYI